MNNLLDIHPAVSLALREGRPVVALESTIISHGMPWPQNVETALAVEQVVRENGALPATIAILDGRCRVGLDTDAIERLGRSKHVSKVSLRDIPYVLSQKQAGATTVAATLRIAAMAGIRVFVTGGIGGVHRGAESTMDISADLTEMATASVGIVSAGIKSILDIGRTLEYLETLGVPVVTYGQSEFPSFYSSRSGHQSPLRLDTTREIAEMMRVKWSLGLAGSVLIANPVPTAEEVPADEIEAHILKALTEANKRNIIGKEVTPFLLRYIAENTKGESLAANIALIRNNAKVGAAIAAALTGV